MGPNEQAYSGQAGLPTTTSDWNRFEFAARSLINKLATATLVRVVALGSSPGLVDIQPLVAQLDGVGNAVPHGTVHDVPCWRYQAGGSAVILDPVPGDLGLAVFAHTDISSVKKTKAPGTPGSRRRFDYSDGIYLGGLLNGEPTQFLRMDADGITLTGTAAVTINAPDGLTINTPTLTVSGDIQTGEGSTFNGKSFDTHTHSGVQTGGGTSGPPS